MTDSRAGKPTSKRTKNGTRLTHASRIYTELRRDILSGQLEPGSRMKTVSLSERFGVGLSPLREALNRLASAGLIVQSDRRGFSVAPISEKELVDIVDTRIWVHGSALRTSIATGDRAWEEKVVLSHYNLTRTPRTDPDSTVDSEEWIDAHRTFHMALLSGCNSDWMMKFCAQIFEAGERYRLVGSIVSDARQQAADEHEAIMQATVDRRADDAFELLSAHYLKTLQHMRGIFDKLARR